jgi:hypothetical protein
MGCCVVSPLGSASEKGDSDNFRVYKNKHSLSTDFLMFGESLCFLV